MAPIMVPSKQEKRCEYTQLQSVESVVYGIKAIQSLMLPSPLREGGVMSTSFPTLTA